MMTGFQDLAFWFENLGVVDFLLPFILVFTVVFAILQRIKIFGEKSKNFNIIIALVLGLLFVVPHITGGYPMGYDPVDVINQSLPSVSLLAIAIVMVLLIMGLIAPDKKFAKGFSSVLTVLSILFIGYIFGSALGFWVGPYDVFYWWTSDITELIIILLVFGLIVSFITADPDKPPREKSRFAEFADAILENKDN